MTKKEEPGPRLKPVFLQTRNVRNFQVGLEGLGLGREERFEGRFLAAAGPAGRGKTRTAVYFSSNGGSPYLLVSVLWRHSTTEFLKTLCREVCQTKFPPWTGSACYGAILDRLLQEDPENPRPIYLDEADKLPQSHIEVCRELSELSGVPFVLLGEEELLSLMKANKRVWSRTMQVVEFEPIAASDIILYAKAAADLVMREDAALFLQKKAEGDFRPVKREVLKLARAAHATGAAEVTLEMVKAVIKTGLWGGRMEK